MGASKGRGRVEWSRPSRKMESRKNEAIWVKFACGVCAGSSSEIATMPFEVMKTRLQLSGDKAVKPGANFRVIKSVVQNEGVAALYKGINAGVARQFIYCGGKMSLYEPVRNFYSGVFGDDSILGKLLAGGTSGATANFCSNPADLMKVRIQADVTGEASRKGLFRLWADCVRSEGVLGLWTGVGPTVLRAFFMNAVELGGYDLTKQVLTPYFSRYGKDDIRLHLCCGTIAGFLSTITSLPFDVMKSRVMVTGSKYTGIAHCVQDTIRNEGPTAFFKGFVPVASRIVPFNIIQFLIFEQARRVFSGEYRLL